MFVDHAILSDNPRLSPVEIVWLDFDNPLLWENGKRLWQTLGDPVLWRKSMADLGYPVLWKKSMADCGNPVLWEKSLADLGNPVL
jgi:hypothetical protein